MFRDCHVISSMELGNLPSDSKCFDQGRDENGFPNDHATYYTYWADECPLNCGSNGIDGDGEGFDFTAPFTCMGDDISSLFSDSQGALDVGSCEEAKNQYETIGIFNVCEDPAALATFSSPNGWFQFRCCDFCNTGT